VPKHQVGNAFCHFASITVFLPAFFPNAVDLAVVAAQIKGRVNNREETNREYRDADHPHARLPPKIRCRRLKPSEAQARHHQNVLLSYQWLGVVLVTVSKTVSHSMTGRKYAMWNRGERFPSQQPRAQ